jgi:hypothetical protein
VLLIDWPYRESVGCCFNGLRCLAPLQTFDDQPPSTGEYNPDEHYKAAGASLFRSKAPFSIFPPGSLGLPGIHVDEESSPVYDGKLMTTTNVRPVVGCDQWKRAISAYP